MTATHRDKSGKRKRRKYDAQFRRSTVQLVLDGLSLAQVGRDLDISTSVISRWRAQQLAAPTKPKAGGKVTDNQSPGISLAEVAAELDRVRRKLTIVEQEREILKKALSIVNKEI